MMEVSTLISSILLLAVLMAAQCDSWSPNPNFEYFHRDLRALHLQRNWNSALFSQTPRHDHRQQPKNMDRTNGFSRRRLLFETIIAAQIVCGIPEKAIASIPNGVVTVRLESQKDYLGVEIYDTTLRGKNIVAIRSIVVPNKNNQFLMEGMVLRPRNGGNITAKELCQRLRSGPFPLEVDFVNLAAGGDAISDLGTSIVTPKDALILAQNTEDSSTNKFQQQKGGGYSITKLRETKQTCAIRSRRNDVLEIEFEASYVIGENDSSKKVLYDASAFRGTGNQPYQMVLGSGDMIPGVDQGLYDMCPGEKRLLTIPPVLGHGPNSRKLYKIPDNYKNLEWEVGLVTIDSTIREDNNDVSREDRESRFAY